MRRAHPHKPPKPFVQGIVVHIDLEGGVPGAKLKMKFEGIAGECMCLFTLCVCAWRPEPESSRLANAATNG